MRRMGKSTNRAGAIIAVFGELANMLALRTVHEDDNNEVADDVGALPQGFKPPQPKSSTPIPSRRHLGS